MKNKIPVIILLAASYSFWGLGVCFLLNMGGLSEKSFAWILGTFVVFLLGVIMPCLVFTLCQIKKGFTPKGMLKSGIIMLGTMIPIWIAGIVVSAAMVSTILLTALVPLLFLMDCAFTIPGLLLVFIGGARCIWSKKS